MTKEMPEWLKRYYNKLWERHRNEAFTFASVTDDIGISKKMASKTLLELEKRGFINKERSPIDYRARTYRLISPVDVNFAIGLYSLMEREKIKKQTLIDKLIFIDERLPYVITGSFAAYHYHQYINPPKVIEIKIHLQDGGKWIAFLTDEKTRVFIGDVIETKKISNYVKLIDGSKRAIDYVRTKTKEGYYIEKPEFLIIELLERQTQNSVIEAVAIIVTNKMNILWVGPTGLPNLAKSCGVSRSLGLLLDAINLEARRKIINPKIIEPMKKYVEGKVDDIFPKDEMLLAKFRDLRNKTVHGVLLTEKEKAEIERLRTYFEGYKLLSEKWGVRIILPRDAIRKVLKDLGVSIGKK